jgi:exodeoxyribonuclease X
MRLIVVDTETTGIEDTDQVVELAIVDVATGKHFTSLIKPSCKITHGARATHHITDKELKNAPDMRNLMATHKHLFLAADVFVAHNAKFDLAMLAQSGVRQFPPKTICTWRCACHLYPHATGHSNQVLRYELGLRVRLPKDLPPHRALPDALVTRALLRHMLTTTSAERLIELTTQPVLQHVVRFGKHRGEKWEAVAPDYLRWILKQQFDDDVRFTAKHWLTVHA